MRARTQRRKKIRRYLNWMARNHPSKDVPPCVLREHNRWAREVDRRQRRLAEQERSEA